MRLDESSPQWWSCRKGGSPWGLYGPRDPGDRKEKQVCKVIRQKAASPFCYRLRQRMHSSATCAGQAHSLAAADEQCVMHLCVYRYVTMGWHMSTQTCRFPCGGYGHPPNTWFLEPTWVSPANGISIGSAIWHSSPVCPTHRHTYHATCDLCSNRLHLCTACRRCDLKIDQSYKT